MPPTLIRDLGHFFSKWGFVGNSTGVGNWLHWMVELIEASGDEI
jgi:hypothetical protein